MSTSLPNEGISESGADILGAGEGVSLVSMSGAMPVAQDVAWPELGNTEPQGPDSAAGVRSVQASVIGPNVSETEKDTIGPNEGVLCLNRSVKEHSAADAAIPGQIDAEPGQSEETLEQLDSAGGQNGPNVDMNIADIE